MKNVTSLLGTITLTTFLSLSSFTAQAVDCEHAKRIGMSQGCSTSGGTGHTAPENIPEQTDCDHARQTGMAQGCSTTGGTGTSITHTAEDGNLGTCRQSYRSGQPVLKGCGDQTPFKEVIPK